MNFLAFDLGASNGRALLGKIENDRLDIVELHRFLNEPVRLPSGLHWNILGLWAEIMRGLKAAAPFHPVSMGLDTWGVDFGLLDKQDALIGNPYHYRDRRTVGMLEEAFKRVPREQIYAQTGIQFMELNSLYQLYSMVMQRSPALDIAQTLLFTPDLLNFWLTGRKVNEFTIATTSQTYSPLSGTWATEVLEALGIPTHIFGEIVSPGAVLGGLREEVALEAGVEGLSVIAPAAHDTGSAVAAVPAANEDFAWLSSGTWSILGAEAREPNLSEKALAFNFTNEGGVFGSWRLSKNLTGLWFMQECKRKWQRSYDELTQLAIQARPFAAVIDVDDAVFFHPGDMPRKIQEYCARTGQYVPQTEGEITRVILESLALKYRLVLEQLDELTGKRHDPLHVIGGGARNELLNQFTADATGRKVITGPVEATATGNILMQAIAMGVFSDLAEARAVVRRSFPPNVYEPGVDARWDEAFAKLQTLA
jgi:rhamnulokinase